MDRQNMPFNGAKGTQLMTGPTPQELREAATRISPYITRTPVISWPGEHCRSFGAGTHVQLKLELFQRSGTFKARGSLVNMLRLDSEQLDRGVTAVSAGNHAVAVAYAARELGTSAKVVMQTTANPARVALARELGADVIMGGDGPACFALAAKIAQEEGRFLVHPFEGKEVALGTGTIGLELYEDCPDLEAVIVAVGGGGLAGGLGSSVRQLYKNCEVFGVEPSGADGMRHSMKVGAAHQHDRVTTIADSLSPPITLPYSFALCKTYLTEIVTVSDDEICAAGALLFREAKLAVEPAAAAATAALIGPLRERVLGKKVGIIICGANIDASGFSAMLKRGAA